MKALLVTGGDYAALQFASEVAGGKTAGEVIENLEAFQSDANLIEEADEITLSVVEVGQVPEEFLKFVRRNIQDYDHSKDTNFWLEHETINP